MDNNSPLDSPVDSITISTKSTKSETLDLSYDEFPLSTDLIPLVTAGLDGTFNDKAEVVIESKQNNNKSNATPALRF